MALKESIAAELVHASHITVQKYKVNNRVNYAEIDSACEIGSRAMDLSTSYLL
jgi:hypothetical protein